MSRSRPTPATAKPAAKTSPAITAVRTEAERAKDMRRVIVWRRADSRRSEDSRSSVADLLVAYPEVRVLRASDPDRAVALMSVHLAAELVSLHPELDVEEDARSRMAGSLARL